MKRVTLLVAAWALALLLCGCDAPGSVVGQWVSAENDAYYFELYEDHTCVMFNAKDEWVSSGTYTVDNRLVNFSMDTGKFTWVNDGECMRFEAGDTVTEYRLATE